ncbi:MAG: hypothetical protein H7Z14_15025 [Anaerolineae bacterium]|nr:hypothetical protein [Phycisphaerae bacterium]
MEQPDLLILGYSEAAMFLKSVATNSISAIISIHGPREFGVECDVKRRLDLSFDDADVPNANDSLAIQSAIARQRWNQRNGLSEVVPELTDAQRIIDFARTLENEGGTLLCHCGAGISRASAAAFICLAVWEGEGYESQCITEVRRLRPNAQPHEGLVRFADQLLARNGKLTCALKLA